MVRSWPSDERVRARVLVAAVGTMLLSWMLLMPPGSHADEPSHVVRSAALVRGVDGDTGYVLPDRYGVAEPACYAFDPTRSAACATWPPVTGADVLLTSRASAYPPGAHLVLGVAGLLPGPHPLWWGRLAATVASTALVAAAVAVALRRDRLTAAALLLGLTPMAWSIMSAVNPSAFATAGAAALWVASFAVLDAADEGEPGRRAGGRLAWLVVAGWVALVLARRDGMVWATVVVAVVTLTAGSSPSALARRLGPARTSVAGVAAAITLLWGLTSPSSSSRLIVLAPLALAAAEVVARWWPGRGTAERRVAIATAAVIGTAAWVALVSTRAGGWSTGFLLTVVGQTDENLIEAIGVLGWLDTPVPAFVVFAWLVTVGVLAAGALRAGSWRPAAALLAITALSSWTLELIQGNDTGTYWQGRYSLPLLVGLPLLLTRRPPDGPVDGTADDALAAPVALAALAFVNVAAWAAARRFGVGVLGSHLPWRWDTPLQPVPPIVLLAVLASASVLLARAVLVGPPSDQR